MMSEGPSNDMSVAFERSAGEGRAKSPALRLREDLRIEEIEGDLIILDAAGEVVHKISGPGVAATRLLQGGVNDDDVPPELSEAVAALVEAELVSGHRAVPRRQALAKGGAAIFGAATVTTFLLAEPAAAWSACKNGKVPTPNDPGSAGKKYTAAGTYTWVSGPSGFHSPNTQRNYNVLVRAWGGGGGGGDDGGNAGGGGGGGGAYAHATISVLECTEYTVVVGAGGPPKTNGGDSYFGSPTTVKAAAGARGTNGAYLNGGDGGAGGAATSSVGATKYSGGKGGDAGVASDTATGGGSAGSGGNGGDGNTSTRGSAGAGNPGGAQGGDDENGARNGLAPGGGGGGDGGSGAPGAVWIGI